jgi:hypothetical protein
MTPTEQLALAAKIAAAHHGEPICPDEPPICFWRFSSCATARAFEHEATLAGLDAWQSADVAGIGAP